MLWIKKVTILTWHYYVEDHLGNKRIVQDEQGKVETSYNYYPFGIIFDHWAELYAKSKQQPFKFNGKELYTMFDFYAYDFGARLYNPLIGRWLGIDPQCEKYYNWSPYAFCADNPINIIDPNGEELFLAGSFDQRMEMLKVLQMLTNDNLLMNRKTGKVTLSGKPRWDKRDKNLAVGTALIRDIINDKHTLTIRVWDGDNMEIPISSHDVKQKGVGSDALISFNPKRRTSLGVAEENGNCEEFVNLPRFALGHELVHGIRDMKGHTASMIATPYKFKNFKVKYSIKTICGDLKLDSYDTLGKITNIRTPFSCIYMQKVKRLKRVQTCNLISILESLNSKVITDTIKGEYKDIWNIDSLVEYSPLFINVYSNEWFGLENELEMIRMYDKRKNR